MGALKGKRLAIVAADGFEESELFEPKRALEEAGASTEVVSLKTGMIRGWNKDRWGREIQVDALVGTAPPDSYDAVLLPGGVMNPDHLRGSEQAINFIRHFVQAHKPIAAICHGPWTLIDAGGVEGRKVTSYKTIRLDLENAGAEWENSPVVVDRGLVTSRQPDDIPLFNERMIEEFGEGVHASAALQSAETGHSRPM